MRLVEQFDYETLFPEAPAMRLPRVRFTVRRMMVGVAVAAVPLAVWAAWLDPVRRWQRDVNDDQDGARRWEAIHRVLPVRLPESFWRVW
jgi:hypothetical protein